MPVRINGDPLGTLIWVLCKEAMPGGGAITLFESNGRRAYHYILLSTSQASAGFGILRTGDRNHWKTCFKVLRSVWANAEIVKQKKPNPFCLTLPIRVSLNSRSGCLVAGHLCLSWTRTWIPDSFIGTLTPQPRQCQGSSRRHPRRPKKIVATMVFLRSLRSSLPWRNLRFGTPSQLRFCSQMPASRQLTIYGPAMELSVSGVI